MDKKKLLPLAEREKLVDDFIKDVQDRQPKGAPGELHIRGHVFKFDMGNPRDAQKLEKAQARAEKQDKLAPPYPYTKGVMPKQDEATPSYEAFLNAQLRIYGDFLDDLLGKGAADTLLGDNPSLHDMDDVQQQLVAELTNSARHVAAVINRYAPVANPVTDG